MTYTLGNMTVPNDYGSRLPRVRVTTHHRDKTSGELFRIAGILLIPFSSAIVFQSIGVLFLHDIIAPLVLLILLAQRGAIRQLAPLKLCFFLMTIWLAGAVMSDLYRGSAPNDFLRGWSRLILLGVNIAMIWLLCKGSLKLISLYSMSSGAAMVIGALTSSDPLTRSAPWKFGMGAGLITLVAGLTGIPYFRKGIQKFFPEIAILGLSMVSLLLNSRTMFAIGALAAGYSLLSRWILLHRRSISKLAFSSIVLVGALVAQAIVMAYEYSASQGWLGEYARRKYLMQVDNDAGLFVSGRSESLVSLEAIRDMPILGHGSWAKDPYYSIVYYVKQKELGLPVPPSWQQFGADSEYIIQSHSHLLGSWVDAGILSVPFWLWTLILAFGSLYAVVARRNQPNIIVIFFSFLVIWDVLFSPFSAQARITKALQIVVLVMVQRMTKNQASGRIEQSQPPMSRLAFKRKLAKKLS